MISLKKTKLAFLLLFSLLFVPGFAQEKLLSLEDACWLNPQTYPQSMRNLQWIGNSHQYSWVAANSLIVSDVKTSKKDTLIRIDDINSALNAIKADSIKRFPSIKWLNENTLQYSSGGTIYHYNANEGTAEIWLKYDEKAQNINLNPIHTSLAYTIDNNLYIQNKDENIQLTDDDEGIVNGQSVHRNEFGINGGIFWSPKGNYLAYYRMDESMVSQYPLVDIDTRIAEVKNIRYPMAGMASHEVSLGVYNPATAETVFMNTGDEPEQYLCSVSWGPEENYIYIALLNRGQDHLKLNKYDAHSGELIKTLFEEKDKEYVEPEHPLFFSEKMPDRFIWYSERDGFMHLYLYTTEGELIRDLTPGKQTVHDILGIDKKGKSLYYMATPENPLEKHVFKCNIAEGSTKQISTSKGTHQAVISEDCQYYIDIFSSFTEDVCREYSLYTNKGKKQKTLIEDKDPLKDYDLGETSMFEVTSPYDGVKLHALMIKPPHFDPGKKYPVFHYVYGGPHMQMITDSWLGGQNLFLNHVAQKGYIVYVLDNHGTPNRGVEFEQAIHRRVGEIEVMDQMAGIEYLKSLDYVDKEHIMVDGWSYGGFMTINLILKHPDTYVAACAGGPVTDWKYYEVMYGERYMDTPQENPDGYESSSLLNRADSLSTDLLILHCTTDPVVMWQNSLQFIQRCIKSGIQLEYFVYPGHEHNVRGRDRVHMYQKIMNFMDERL